MAAYEKYQEVKKLSDQSFRRFTGVKRSTFLEMVRVVREVEEQKTRHGRRPREQSTEDQVLMCLEYLREDRTYFHLAQSYGLWCTPKTGPVGERWFRNSFWEKDEQKRKSS